MFKIFLFSVTQNEKKTNLVMDEVLVPETVESIISMHLLNYS